jgi:ABC-type phosphate transport system permease subunit
MSSLLANNFGEASRGDTQRGALMLIGLLLLCISLAINILARYLFGTSARPSASH